MVFSTAYYRSRFSNDFRLNYEARTGYQIALSSMDWGGSTPVDLLGPFWDWGLDRVPTFSFFTADISLGSNNSSKLAVRDEWKTL